MTYSLDFRKKVLAVRERESLSFEDVALRFDIGSKNTVFRWTKQLEPCKTRNKLATIVIWMLWLVMLSFILMLTKMNGPGG